MVINNENIHEVNNISLHDACFESFVFDRVHNRLETVVKPEWPFVVPPDFDSSESFERRCPTASIGVHRRMFFR